MISMATLQVYCRRYPAGRAGLRACQPGRRWSVACLRLPEFTTVTVKEAVDCVKRSLQADATWELQSPIPISTIIKLLTICLEDTTFNLREDFYQMTDGLAMGSPVSPVVANILMEDLERNAIATMTDRPRLWLRFVDDTLASVKRYALQVTLDHLNQQNPAIQFTMEVEKDGKLPILDAEIERYV